MFVLYGLLFIAMFFGLSVLIKGYRGKGAAVQASEKKSTPNAAHSNDGGNSQQAESVLSASETTYNHNSLGADNDDDKL